MTPYLKHLHLRLEQAKKHMDNFNRQGARFINSTPYEMVTEKDTDGVNQLLRVKAKSEKEPPPELGFIAGDCIHNLRAILDNIVWQIGGLYGCPKRKLDKMTFPLRITPESFGESLKSLDCLPKSAIDIIESLQPYQPYRGRSDPSMHPLRVLDRLWNEDKHRSPVLIVTLHKSTQIIPKPQRVRLPDGTFSLQASLPHHTVYLGDKLYDGKEIVTFTLQPNEPYPELDLRFTFQLAFDVRGPTKGQPAAKCLRELYDFVRDEVLAKFEPIFPK